MALHDAARASLSISDSETALYLVRKLMESFAFADSDGWWGEDYSYEIKEARKHTDRQITYWKERANHFHASAALDEEVAKLPNWFYPQPGDDVFVPEEDPDYRTYVRLKEKFEQ